MPLLSAQHLSKRFGNQAALADMSLEVEQGEFIALLGPSGCGKTTLLRCVAGFLAPDAGRVVIDGHDVTKLPPYRRPLNTVFQNYALFPHMTVLENVMYGPRRQGVAKSEAAERAAGALDLVGLASLGKRLPRQLSGGQQQRVALARAIVNRPKLLLLDEPLSALDLKLRKRMQLELKHLQEKLGIAFVFVTHDQEEAMAMADRIVVMNGGRIEQAGTGGEIYRKPATRFVAEFIGEANFIACRPDGGDGLRPEIGSRSIRYGGIDPARRYVAVLRPEYVEILDGEPADGLSIADGAVEEIVAVGGHTMIYVRVGETVLAAKRLGMQDVELGVGRPVRFGFRPEHIHVIVE